MYMAPEIIAKFPYQGIDVDNFAFGVTMLVARTFSIPFTKAEPDDTNYKNLACYNGMDANLFWENYKDLNLSVDFINLITSMLSFQPSSRPSTADILGHKWMKGETVTKQEFIDHCTGFMTKAEELL